MHINRIRNLPCPAPSPSVQSPPRPGPRYLPEPEAQPPAPRLPSGHRLDTYLSARTRGPRPGRPPANKEAGAARPGSLGPESLGTRRPRAPRRGWQSRAAVGCRPRAGPDAGGRGGSQVQSPPRPLLPPPLPSFCYLDFFSCCVMSIIYAKRFAACCTSRASRRGRRSGKGGGSGERRTARGGGEEPQAPPGTRTQGLWGA